MPLFYESLKGTITIFKPELTKILILLLLAVLEDGCRNDRQGLRERPRVRRVRVKPERFADSAVGFAAVPPVADDLPRREAVRLVTRTALLASSHVVQHCLDGGAVRVRALQDDMSGLLN